MNKDYYVVLHGAKKNVGDFLIRERAKKLLNYLRPDRELIEFPSWESLDDKVEIVNNAKALIIMGGPGASGYLYPKYYPLFKDINLLKVPFVLLGVGSYEKVYNDCLFKNFSLNKDVKKLLLNNPFISTRDFLSDKLFHQVGVNSKMTGCPVFYNLDYLGKKKLNVSNNKKIVFTPPADMTFKYQAIEIMKWIAKEFKGYEVYCSFNRGYKADKYTTIKYEKSIKDIVEVAKKLDFILSDVSYDLSKIDYYNECDFHIGYRLHTHIHFISRRVPSFLITEDSRSYGHLETVKLPILRGEKENIFSKLYCLNNMYVKAILNRTFSPISSNDKIVEDLKNFVKKEINNGFSSFDHIPDLLDKYFEERMKPFILSLP